MSEPREPVTCNWHHDDFGDLKMIEKSWADSEIARLQAENERLSRAIKAAVEERDFALNNDRTTELRLLVESYRTKLANLEEAVTFVRPDRGTKTLRKALEEAREALEGK